MNNKEPRNVYILTIPSFRKDWVRIGNCSRPVNVLSCVIFTQLHHLFVKFL